MNGTYLRSRAVLWLTAAALLTSLVFGAVFITLHHTKDLRGEAVEAPESPLSDEQTLAQVVGTARQFVAVGRLRNVVGTYLLQSCESDDEPPYQGSAYIDFDVPSITATPAFFRQISAALRARGWTEGLTPNNHPGGKVLVKDGVSATVYRNPDVAGRGVLQIYGECRNMTDHRGDATGFVEITDRLRG
jgi:hypothetical protein